MKRTVDIGRPLSYVGLMRINTIVKRCQCWNVARDGHQIDCRVGR